MEPSMGFIFIAKLAHFQIIIYEKIFECFVEKGLVNKITHFQTLKSKVAIILKFSHSWLFHDLCFPPDTNLSAVKQKVPLITLILKKWDNMEINVE